MSRKIALGTMILAGGIGSPACLYCLLTEGLAGFFLCTILTVVFIATGLALAGITYLVTDGEEELFRLPKRGRWRKAEVEELP